MSNTQWYDVSSSFCLKKPLLDPKELQDCMLWGHVCYRL